MRQRWMMWYVSVGVSVFLLGSAGAGRAWAQVTTGTIFGAVTDESQAALPGATITVRNTEIGLTRSVPADDQGRYRVPNLPLGSYEIQAELTGFQTALRSGIVLTLGREAEVSFSLKVGDLTEKVEVRGEAALVDTQRSQIADLVDQKQVQNLPLNARSYTDLALLQPGVMARTRTGGYSGVSGGGVGLSISGARPMNTAFYVDGTDIKDPYGRTPGSAAGTTLGVDTIREFQVMVNSFSAQYGGSGGVINSVTKSGTNALHGDAFYFMRDAKLDAANFFDTTGEPTPFHRNQAGFTVGGPIRRDRTFYFGSYERLNDRFSRTTTINVPGADLRAGITPTGVVTVHPTTQKFLDAMPLPNGRVLANGIGEYTSVRDEPTDENYATGRVDHKLSDRDSFFVRYTYDKASNASPLAFPQFTANSATFYQYVTAQYDKILSPTLLNTASFAVNRSRGTTFNSVDGLDDSYSLIPGRVPAQLQVPGLSNWGNDGQNDRQSTLTSFQFRDKLSWTRGRHNLVTGVEFTHVLFDSYSGSRIHGRLRFNSLNDFLVGKPISWEFLVPGTGEMRYFRQNQLALYAQDDFKLRSNLTVNVGLRYEVVTTPTEKDGQISNLRDWRDSTEVLGDPFFLPQKNNFGPRVGVAWDPTNDGKTAIRGGFGLFYQPLTYSTWAFAATQQAPYFLRAQIDNPTYPPPYQVDPASLPPGNPTPMTFEPNTPYYTQFNATVQRQLRSDTVVSVSYAGSRGRNLASALNYNVAQFEILPDGSKYWPVGATRFNPNYATIETRGFNTRSAYDALQVRANKRFTGGLQLQSSYTWAKNMDHTSETVSAGISDAYDLDADWGLSNWDTRHNWVFNFIYPLPFSARQDWIGAVFGRWQVSGILQVATGTPRTVSTGFNQSRDLNNLSSLGVDDRPNLRPGASVNPVLGGVVQYYDPNAFELEAPGTQGNVGRNTLIGPGLATFDLSLVKNVPFGGARSIQLRAEAFNLTNRTNLGGPNTTIFNSANGIPNPSFGRITSTSTSARQVQLAVKVLF